MKKILNKRISDLDLSVRTKRCMASENIIFIKDLIKRNEYDLKAIPTFGRKSFYEIIWVLKDLGLSLTSNPDGVSIVDKARLTLKKRIKDGKPGKNKSIKTLSWSCTEF